MKYTYLLHKYLIRFSDTMAYGSHHFLTNFRFQCAAREDLLFAPSADGGEPWREEIAPLELLTQQGHCHNLKPVQLGKRVAVVMGVQGLEPEGSDFWLTFRVVDQEGTPVTVGYQRIVAVRTSDHLPTSIPPHMFQQLEKLQEPNGLNVIERVNQGGAVAASLFTSQLCEDSAAALLPGMTSDRIVASAAEDDAVMSWLVCGGQGTGDPLFLQEAHARWPWAQEVIEACLAHVRKTCNRTLCVNSPENIYDDQIVLYLTSLIGGIAVSRNIQGRWGVLGHSVGEITALALSEAIDYSSGAEAIVRRTESLVEHASNTGSMIVVFSTVDRVHQALEGLHASIAVVNHEQQVVIAVSQVDSNTCIKRLDDMSLLYKRLSAPFPFHSSLVLSAVQPCAENLAKVSWSAPKRPLYSPMEKKRWVGRQDTAALLASHFIRPLHFAEALTPLITRPGKFIDCSPRNIMANLVRTCIGEDGKRRVCQLDQIIERQVDQPTRIDKTRDTQEELIKFSDINKKLPTSKDSCRQVVIVGIGCCLPGAPDTNGLLGVIQTGVVQVRNEGEFDAHIVSDFVSEELRSDKTYTDLTGAVREIPFVEACAADWDNIPRGVRMSAAALDEAWSACAPSASPNVPTFIGAVADGCKEYDQALSLQRSQLNGVPQAAINQAGGADPAIWDQVTWLKRTSQQIVSGAEVCCIDAACASSLYALDIAVRTVRSGAVSCAVAGGTFAPGFANNCLFAQFKGLSSSGSFPLSAEADGVVFGEGAAFVVVKSLEEAERCGDTILAVVAGGGLSSDGAGASVSKPQASGQELAIARAWEETALEPHAIDLIEAHATGTTVGDNIEISALSNFFQSHASQVSSIPVASIKSLIGHTGWASGTASVVKSVLAMKHEFIPHHFHSTPPKFPVGSPLYLAEKTKWENKPAKNRSIGINSFGFGGSNAHIILADKPAVLQSRPNGHATTVARHTQVYHVDDIEKMREGLMGMRLLPDVIDNMDLSQIVAVDMAKGVLAHLKGWESLKDKLGVIVGMPGKTSVMVEAEDRIFADQNARLLKESGWNAANAEMLQKTSPEINAYTLTGGMPNIISGRVAQMFGLNGPNFVVDDEAFSGAAAKRLTELLISDHVCSAILTLDILPEMTLGCSHTWHCEINLVAEQQVAEELSWTAIPIGFDRKAAMSCWSPSLHPVTMDKSEQILNERIILPENTIPEEGNVICVWRHDFGAITDGLCADDAERQLLSHIREWSQKNYDALASGRVAVAVIGCQLEEQNVVHPATGLYAGFLKSLARELPDARMAAIYSAIEITDSVIREALQQSGLREWFIRPDGTRWEFALTPLVAAKPKTDSWSGATLITGGARGVAGVLAGEYLKHSNGPLVILGRSDLRALPHTWKVAEEHDLAVLAEAHLAALMEEGAKPKDARKNVDALLGLRGLYDSIQDLSQAAKNEVLYYSCDILNRDAVQAVVQEIVLRFGDSLQVVHCAGIQVSQNLKDKSAEVFEHIVATKLDGLNHILSACQKESVRPSVSLASSAYSYIGNDGQEDYGAANEYMLRLALSQREEGWQCIAWPAWDGIGMTRGQEYHALAERRSMRGIARHEGAQIFRNIMNSKEVSSVIILPESELKNPSIRFAQTAVVSDVQECFLNLDEEQKRALASHRVQGKPVYPACLTLRAWQDMLTEHVYALKDITFEKKITPSQRWRYRCCQKNKTMTIQGDFYTPDGILRHGGQLCAQAQQIKAEDKEWMTKPPLEGKRIQDPYVTGEGVVELGEEWKCLETILIGQNSRCAKYRPQGHNHFLSGDKHPPLLVDALLRLSTIVEEDVERTWLPVRIDELVWYEEVKQGSDIMLIAETPKIGETGIVCSTAYAVNTDGSVIVGIRGVEGHHIAHAPLAVVTSIS